MFLGFRRKLLDVKILDFEPRTNNDNPIERKTHLLEKIKSKIDLEKVKEDCKNKLFSLRVIYYLNKNSKVQGQYQKDLDNMTKIVSDVLTEYLSKQDRDNKNQNGLGLMPDDDDIHELHLVKKFIQKDADQGLHIQLYKLGDKKIKS